MNKFLEYILPQLIGGIVGLIIAVSIVYLMIQTGSMDKFNETSQIVIAGAIGMIITQMGMFVGKVISK